MNINRVFKLIMQGKTMSDKLVLLRYFRNRLFYDNINLDDNVTLKNENGIYFCGNSIRATWVTSSVVEDYLKDYFYINTGAFIDVGAHYGKYSVMMSNRYPHNNIIAIEPDVNNIMFLEFNRWLNKQFFYIRKVGAYSKKTQLTFVSDNDSGLNSSFIKTKSNYDVIDVDKLDNLITLKVDLIKIDAEGCEKEVLLGATRILKEDHPNIIFECVEENSLRECKKILKKHGYYIKQIKEIYYFATWKMKV